MTGVERILLYTHLPPEEGPLSVKPNIPRDWPTEGNIEFRNVSLSYDDNTTTVLNNISFCVRGKEKVSSVQLNLNLFLLFQTYIYKFKILRVRKGY